MNKLIQNIRHRAAVRQKHIVFPEGDDPRVQKAAHFLVDEQICSVTMLHSGSLSSTRAIRALNYVDDPPNIDLFTQSLWEKRQHKMENPVEAKSLLKNPLYYGASMVDAGIADGCVTGAVATTAEVIKAAIQVIGLKENRSFISSTFLIDTPNDDVFTYADCGVVPYPGKRQLADIALESAQTHERLTENKARIAMLSFSTKGSAPHARSQLVRDALKIAKKKNPKLIIDGELQFDAAFVPEVAARKAPDSILKGKANVFIFPNLDAANIAYKITERLAGASATGPILQGLARPMMDLSRGCSCEDIINGACVAILMDEEHNS